MKKRAYSLLVTIIVLFLLAGAAFFIRHQTRINPARDNVQRTEVAVPTDSLKNIVNSVEIIFTSTHRINGKTSENTVLAALETIAKENNLSVKTKPSSFGVLVEGIDGYFNTKEAFWMYQVNGKAGNVAADRYIINSEDTIVWEYKKITP